MQAGKGQRVRHGGSDRVGGEGRHGSNEEGREAPHGRLLQWRGVHRRGRSLHQGWTRRGGDGRCARGRSSGLGEDVWEEQLLEMVIWGLGLEPQK